MAVVNKSSQSEYERRVTLSLDYNVKTTLFVDAHAVPIVKMDIAVILTQDGEMGGGKGGRGGPLHCGQILVRGSLNSIFSRIIFMGVTKLL